MSRELQEFQDARIVGRIMLAMEHSSPAEMKQYLKDHPNADRKNHRVEKHDEKEKTEEKGEKKEEHGEGEHEAPKKSLKEHIKSLSEGAQAFVKNSPAEVKKFLTNDSHRRKTLMSAHSALVSAPEKVVKRVISTVKEEIHEFKEAGAGIKAVLSGKKMSAHEKKAFKKVAFHVGLTIAATALTVTGGPFAGMAAFGKSMVKHVAMKAASSALGHIHVLEEMGHIGHGVQHIIEKFAADGEAKKMNAEQTMVEFVMAAMAKELKDLDGNSEVMGKMIEEASKAKGSKEASELEEFQDSIIVRRMLARVAE